MVVSEDDAIAGIVSERDVVRHLGDDGAERSSTARWPTIMTADVVTCTPQTAVEDLARTMTERRIRHVPVVDDDGALVGIVSIGDVVKSRISELEGERDDLVGYIGTRSRPQPAGGGGRIRFSCTSVAARRPVRSWIDAAVDTASAGGRHRFELHEQPVVGARRTVEVHGVVEAGAAAREAVDVELDEPGAHVGEVDDRRTRAARGRREAARGCDPRCGATRASRRVPCGRRTVDRPQLEQHVARCRSRPRSSDLGRRDVGGDRHPGEVAALLVDVERRRRGEDRLAVLERDDVPGRERAAVAVAASPA